MSAIIKPREGDANGKMQGDLASLFREAQDFSSSPTFQSRRRASGSFGPTTAPSSDLRVLPEKMEAARRTAEYQRRGSGATASVMSVSSRHGSTISPGSRSNSIASTRGGQSFQRERRGSRVNALAQGVAQVGSSFISAGSSIFGIENDDYERRRAERESVMLIQEVKGRIVMLVPTSKSRQIWNVVLVLVVCWGLLIWPLDLAFNVQSGIAWQIAELLIDFAFLFDCTMNFFTPYMDHSTNLWVTSPRKIAIHYASTWFFIDFVSSIPINLIVLSLGGGEDTASLDLIKTAKIGRLMKSVRILRVSRVFKLLGKNVLGAEVVNTWRIVRLLVLFALLAHLLGCLLYFISTFDDDLASQSWAWAEGIHPHQSATRGQGHIYLVAVHNVLLLTFGETVKVETDGELVFVIMVLLVGAVVNAALFGQMALLIANYNRAGSRYQEKMDSVGEHAKNLELAPDLIHRIQDYCEWEWKLNRCLDRNKFIASLSTALQDEICMVVTQDLVRSVPFMADLEQACIVEILKSLISTLHLKGDCIVTTGRVGRDMYFIREGRCEVFAVKGLGTPDEERIWLANLDQGSFFGELALLVDNQKRTATVRAVTNCDLFMLRRDDFLSVLEEFPDSKTKIRGVINHAYKRLTAERGENVEPDEASLGEEHTATGSWTSEGGGNSTSNGSYQGRGSHGNVSVRGLADEQKGFPSSPSSVSSQASPSGSFGDKAPVRSRSRKMSISEISSHGRLISPESQKRTLTNALASRPSASSFDAQEVSRSMSSSTSGMSTEAILGLLLQKVTALEEQMQMGTKAVNASKSAKYKAVSPTQDDEELPTEKIE